MLFSLVGFHNLVISKVFILSQTKFKNLLKTMKASSENKSNVQTIMYQKQEMISRNIHDDNIVKL